MPEVEDRVLQGEELALDRPQAGRHLQRDAREGALDLRLLLALGSVRVRRLSRRVSACRRLHLRSVSAQAQRSEPTDKAT